MIYSLGHGLVHCYSRARPTLKGKSSIPEGSLSDRDYRPFHLGGRISQYRQRMPTEGTIGSHEPTSRS